MRILYGLSALALLQACATPKLPPSPAESSRIAIKKVRLTAGTRRPEIRLDAPVRGWLAGIPAGACDVAKALWDVGGDPSADQAAALALFAPAGLIVGAFVGPFVAFDPEEVERDERLLRGILDQADAGWASRVEGALEKAIPGSFGREEGDAVLSVELVEVSLTGPFWLDPQDRPSIRIRARLARSTDGQELYAADLFHSGEARPFSLWADSPDPLEEYLERALQDLCEKIVDEVFLTLPPPEESEK